MSQKIVLLTGEGKLLLFEHNKQNEELLSNVKSFCLCERNINGEFYYIFGFIDKDNNAYYSQSIFLDSDEFIEIFRKNAFNPILKDARDISVFGTGVIICDQKDNAYMFGKESLFSEEKNGLLIAEDVKMVSSDYETATIIKKDGTYDCYGLFPDSSFKGFG